MILSSFVLLLACGRTIAIEFDGSLFVQLELHIDQGLVRSHLDHSAYNLIGWSNLSRRE